MQPESIHEVRVRLEASAGLPYILN